MNAAFDSAASSVNDRSTLPFHAASAVFNAAFYAASSELVVI